MGLSEEGATADGGESGCAGAGGVEKGGLLAALQAEGLRRVVHDHAAFYKAKAVGEGGRPTLLSPAERVWEEVRRVGRRA